MPAFLCPHCGLPLLPDEASSPLCPACQAPLTKAALEPAPPREAAPATPSRPRSFGAGLAAGALLGLAAAGLGAWLAWLEQAARGPREEPPAAARAPSDDPDSGRRTADLELRKAQARIQELERGAAQGRALLARARAQAEGAEKRALSLARTLDEDRRARRPVWETVELVRATARSGARLTRQKDGPILVSGKRGVNPEVYTVVARTDLANITGFRLEALPDEGLRSRGPGRSDNGNFVLSELRVGVMRPGQKERPAALPLHRAQATYHQGGFPPASAIDNNPATGWAIAPELGKAHEAVFEARKPVAVPKGAVLVFTLEQRYGGDHTLGKFRLTVTAAKGPLSLCRPPGAGR